MKKTNCWEFMKCGRGPSDNGGGRSSVCPVAEKVLADGANGGVNGGRICWIIAENCDDGSVHCSAMHRKTSCFSCEFRYRVMADEGLLNVCRATGHFLEVSDL